MPIDVEIPEVDTVVTFPDGMTQDEMAKAINLRFFPTPTNIAASHDTMLPPPGGLIGGVPAVIGPDEQKAMEEIGADIARRPPEPRIPYPIPFEMAPFNLSPESSLMKGKGVVAGVGRSVAKVVNGMLTEPSNVFALALGAIPGVARRAVGAYFAFKAMEEFPHIVVQAEDNWDKMNAGQKAEAYSDLGIAALTVLGGGKLAAGKPVEVQLAERVPDIVKSSEFKEFVAAQEKAAQPTLETLAPKTAEALKAAEVPTVPTVSAVSEAKPPRPLGPSPIEAAEAFKEPERAAVKPEDYVEPTGEVVVRGEEFKAKEAATIPAEANPIEPRIGKVGDMLSSGQVVKTASGRLTSPFPKVSVGTERKTQNTVRQVDKWLRDNALAEAESRGDEFNALQFRNENPKNLPQASKDAMEEYLFGTQPQVQKPLLKPAKPAEAPAETPAVARQPWEPEWIRKPIEQITAEQFYARDLLAKQRTDASGKVLFDISEWTNASKEQASSIRDAFVYTPEKTTKTIVEFPKGTRPYEAALDLAEAIKEGDGPGESWLPIAHKEAISKALKAGKPVPPEVLADYPELKPAAAPTAVEIENKRVIAELEDQLKEIAARKREIRKEYKGVRRISLMNRTTPNIERGQRFERAMSELEVEENAIGRHIAKLKTEIQSPPSIGPGAQTVGEPPKAGPGIVGMGGAVPAEFERSPGRPTAMKYRLIDVERQKRGLEPLVKPESVSDQVVLDKAMAKIDQDPSAPEKLIAELLDKPRAIEDWENHMLLLRKIDLRNEYEKSARAAAQAYDDGRLADAARENEQTEYWSNKLSDLEQASRLSGSERGRSLRALRVMVNEDFSLASLELQKRADVGFRPLTVKERADLQRIADDYKKANADLQAIMATKDQRISNLENQRAFEQIKTEAPKGPSYHPSIIAHAERFVAAMEKQSKVYLKDLMGATWSPTPEMLYKAAFIGATKLARGTLELAKWTDAMVADLGEKFRPYAKQVYEMSQKQLDAELAKAEAQPKAPKISRAVKKLDESEQKQAIIDKLQKKVEKGDIETITPLVQKLARFLVSQGIKTRDTLIDAVHEVLKDIIPDITRRQAMDAISGYGQYKLLTKDEISVQLRDLKGQMQQVAKLEDMASGQAPSKTGLERRIPSDIERQLIQEVERKKKEGGYTVTDPATQLRSALQTIKTRIRNRIVDLETKLANGDFTTKKPRHVPYDQEALTLQHKLELVKREWYEGRMRDRMAQRTTLQKVGAGIGEAINSVRAILTSFDLSAVLRQGGFIVLGHPIRGLQSFPAMFRAWGSKEGAFRAEQEIVNRKNYPLYAQSKLFLSEHGQKLSQMEEMYMSRWAEKIPGVGASQRAYTVFLNKLRADSFDAMAANLSKTGTPTPIEAKAIANFINVVTGRGKFGASDNAAVGLNTVFFAPRFVLSRFQTALGQPLYHGYRGSFRTGAQITKEYARFLAGVAVVYALGVSAGGSIEIDPRSSDFGKIRFGNTRIDPLSGMSQGLVLLSRIGSGQTKTLKGKLQPIRGPRVPYGGSTTPDVIARFLRTKLAPVPGLALNIATGKDVVGNPVTLKSALMNTAIPISLQDILQVMQTQGVPPAIAMGLLSILGMSIQTYNRQKTQSNW